MLSQVSSSFPAGSFVANIMSQIQIFNQASCHKYKYLTRHHVTNTNLESEIFMSQIQI